MDFDLTFYSGKRVLVTGHTGFKGAWLCALLERAGAEIIGYSRCSEKEISLFSLLGLENSLRHIKGDVRDLDHLKRVFDTCRPEIVFHLAAQPLVRLSYAEPAETYGTNVMGTVNLLDCVRTAEGVRSVLNVTTDKVYKNLEREEGYREDEELDGYDPYSNSKSCSELVTAAYKRSFFQNGSCAVSTARAGNVIGGGDFAKDRIIPDCVRAAVMGEDIIVRNPNSVRPFQHVLEPLYVYLMIAAAQFDDPLAAGSYNVGPELNDCLHTGELADLFVKYWGGNLRWVDRSDNGPHEATFLRLDTEKLKSRFGWRARWDIEKAVEKTVEWSKCWAGGGDVRACTDRQIEEFLSADR